MKQASRRKYHYIYKITRTFDDKFYIGMHSTENLEDDYFGSGKLITRSIKKHGKDKHSKEILEYLPCRDSLKLREKELVNKELLEDKKCMNLKVGGEGGWPPGVGFKGFINEEHRQKCSSAGGKQSWHKSLHLMHTQESREKAIATKHKNGAHIASCSKMRESANSLESIKKRKATFAERGHMQGEKNPNFGTCWVVKENIKPIKIKKEQLDEYIQNGYSRGRK